MIMAGESVEKYSKETYKDRHRAANLTADDTLTLS